MGPIAQGGKEAVRVDEEVLGSSEIRALEKRIRELERVLGRKTLKNEILWEAVKVAHGKTDLALAVIARRGSAVKTVADTLGASRSQLHARLGKGSRPRGRYQNTDDAEILVSIRALTDDRPTYGYRRIWALLNRQRGAAGLSRRNHKRIHRLMLQNGLLLRRYTGKPPGRAHDGQCVRVAFALDTCDREVMSWVATQGGISGEMIRDLMLESLEMRFGRAERLPHLIEWLSNNGSCYRAH
jgi:putative transposase